MNFVLTVTSGGFNSNATALLLKIACLPQAGIEKFEIV